MDSTAACERRNRFASVLSSCKTPNNRSMKGLPNWLASWRAKKMTLWSFPYNDRTYSAAPPLYAKKQLLL
jgi:hypothetical protein